MTSQTFVMLGHARFCNFMLWHNIMLCYDRLCQAMLYRVMLCDDKLCYVNVVM